MIEKKTGGFAVVEVVTGRIVCKTKTHKECAAFLKNQREYAYSPVFKKGQHYAV
jgi:hypothetical protein